MPHASMTKVLRSWVASQLPTPLQQRLPGFHWSPALRRGRVRGNGFSCTPNRNGFCIICAVLWSVSEITLRACIYHTERPPGEGAHAGWASRPRLGFPIRLGGLLSLVHLGIGPRAASSRPARDTGPEPV